MGIFKITLLIFIFNLRIQQAICDTQVYSRVSRIDSGTNFPNSLWQNSNTQVTCNQNDAEFNQVILGNYQLTRDSIANTLNIKNLPPHFEVNFRVDIYIIETWDNETVSIIAGSQGQTLSIIKYDHSQASQVSQKWEKTCQKRVGKIQDQKINYFQRNEHTLIDANSNFSISFRTDCKENVGKETSGCEDISNESFAIGQVQVFVNECHFSCLSCSGPSSSQCESCFNNINPTNGVCPQCSGASSIFDNGICVSSCPSEKINKNQVCIAKNQFCQTFQQNGYDCQECQINYFLWNGICVSTCPLFYDNINNACQDQIRSLPQGFVALEGLQRQRFSSFHILQLGFSIQNLNPSNSKLFFQGQNQQYTVCGDTQLLGGFRSGVTQTKFMINVQLSQTRKFLQIGFKFYLVDYSQNNPIPNILVNLNGVTVQLVSSQYIKRTSFNLCGFEQQDAYGEFKYILVDSVSPNLSVTIDNQSNFDIGIRDFLVGGYSCADSCQNCPSDNPHSCLSCYNGFYLLGDKCGTDCPSGYYEDKVLNQCIQCQATFPNCKICDKNQCLICQNSYYFTSSNNCVTCSLSPVKQYWDPINFQCTNTCSSGLQPDDQNQICRNKCDDQACLICDPTSQKICQQCQQGHYLYNNSCVQSCPTGTFLDNKNCLDCDPSCQTCFGPSYNQCSSCFDEKDSKVILDQSINMCLCDSQYYQYDTISQTCTPICNDKHKTPDEQCEVLDPSLFDNSKCVNCKVQSGYKCFSNQDFDLDICTTVKCGDGIRDSDEQCDDGNQISSDYCSLDCKVNLGYECSQAIGQSYLKCKEKCGDSLKSSSEECDPPGIGCSSNCQILPGYRCEQVEIQNSLTNFKPTQCFKCQSTNCQKCEIINNVEICLICESNYFLDSLSNSCQKCHSSCSSCKGTQVDDCLTCPDDKSILFVNGSCKKCDKQEGLYFNSLTEKCEELCGKGFMLTEKVLQQHGLTKIIECDDGNTVNNDGCSQICKIENGFKCINPVKKDQDFIGLSLCTTLTDGPSPFLKLEEQYIRLQNYYQIQGEIFFDRQIFISSTQNIISYLDVQNSQDYEIKIFTEDVILNILMTQTIKIQIKIYKQMKNVNIFIKFKQSDIIDTFNRFLLKKSIISQLPQIQVSAQDTYGNIVTITVLNAFLGFLSYFMIFFAPFNTVVTLFDLLQSVNYLKFLNLNYPKELYVFLRIFDFANFEFFPNINAKNAAVPLTFQREQVDSFLFSNLIQTILVWALFLVFYLLSFGYKKLKIKSIKFIDNLMSKIYTNFFFKIASGIVVFTFYEITLCIWLQLNDVQSETSVKSTIGVIFATMFLASQILIVHLGLNKSKKEDSQNGIKNIIQNIQSKFQQFTISNFIKKYYFINGFILIRKIIYIFLLIYSQSNKVQQIVFVQLLFSLETIIIIIKRPYLEAKMNQIQIFTHINFLVALFSITWLVYDDITNNFSTQARHILSAVCIIPISLIFLTIIIYLFQTLKEKIQLDRINLSKGDKQQQKQNVFSNL